MKTIPPHVPISAPRTSCAVKNDSLGWADGFAVTIDGVSVGIRSNDSDFLPELRQLLPDWSEHSDARRVDVLLSFLKGRQSDRKGVRHYHVVYSHWTRIVRVMELEYAKSAFATSLIEGVAENACDSLYLIGEAVSLGKSAVLVAGSKDSRAPVVDRLCLQGGTRISPLIGDILVLHDDYSVSGLSRQGALPVSKILVANRGCNRPSRPKRLSPGHGMMFMLPVCPLRDNKPDKAMAYLAGLAKAVDIYEGSFLNLEKSLTSLKVFR